MKAPRVVRAYECSHMRPVVRVDDEWRHVTAEGRAVGPCVAGVYVVTASYEGEHYVHELAPRNDSAPR